MIQHSFASLAFSVSFGISCVVGGWMGLSQPAFAFSAGEYYGSQHPLPAVPGAPHTPDQVYLSLLGDGYELQAPLIKDGVVYVADVIDREKRALCLILNVYTGLTLQAFQYHRNGNTSYLRPLIPHTPGPGYPGYPPFPDSRYAPLCPEHGTPADLSPIAPLQSEILPKAPPLTSKKTVVVRKASKPRKPVAKKPKPTCQCCAYCVPPSAPASQATPSSPSTSPPALSSDKPKEGVRVILPPPAQGPAPSPPLPAAAEPLPLPPPPPAAYPRSDVLAPSEPPPPTSSPTLPLKSESKQPRILLPDLPVVERSSAPKALEPELSLTPVPRSITPKAPSPSENPEDKDVIKEP